ncbi:D-alanine--D-alanine ligase [Candidatus Parcubacteria bacterium]|jgi:D-alanine-D-alanine ligase|nr:D-alanine--D-alanine ligase [Candidatus Parcubacteria bacterium]MBT7228937.1 D-alanine--D-alanine ligase [Candidatus Parcubacteria bacterium]
MQDKDIKIAVLTGGDSSERSVALQSAKNVLASLRKRYNVKVFDFPKGLDTFSKEYKNFDVAVPIFHGPGGEDGAVQGYLKTLGVPFIFSDIEAHAIGMNKENSKLLVEKAGIKTPGSQILKQTKLKYSKPVVIKPLAGGSSIGINIARNQVQLDKALKEALKYDQTILVEDYIKGDEFTVSIIEDKGKEFALPVIEIRSKNKFFDYQSKYDPDLVEEICPAPIDKKLSSELQRLALLAHQTIGARHLSRSDFIISGKNIYFLEINTIPGITKNSLLPKSLLTAGINLEDLLDYWIKTSL